MFKLTSQLILLTRVWIRYTRPLKPKPRDSGGKQWHPTGYLSNICSCRVGRETLSSNEADNQLSQYCIPTPTSRVPHFYTELLTQTWHPGKRMVFSIRKDIYIHTPIYITFLFLTFKYKNTTLL